MNGIKGKWYVTDIDRKIHEFDNFHSVRFEDYGVYTRRDMHVRIFPWGAIRSLEFLPDEDT